MANRVLQGLGWAGVALVFAALIGVWEIASRAGWISDLMAPAPSQAIAALFYLVKTGQLWLHLAASLQRLLLGWTLGAVASEPIPQAPPVRPRQRG